MLDAAAVQALPLADYLKGLAFALVVGGAGTVGLFRNLIRARAIEDTPTSKIRSAAQGYVEIVGRCVAVAQPLQVAPLTGQPCVWYRYEIARFQRSRNGGRWRRIEYGESGKWFEIDDGTGRCRVDPVGAEITPLSKDVWYGDSPRPKRGPGRGPGRGGGLFGGPYRYTEERLHVDDPAYVLGNFATARADPAARRAERVRERLVRLKRDRTRLIAGFDRNGDGEIDQAEWEQARSLVERAVDRELAAQPAPEAVSWIGMPPLRRQPYLIACHDQRALAKRYRRYSFFSLLAAAPGASLGLWLLIARFWSG